MGETDSKAGAKDFSVLGQKLKKLSLELVRQIDDALTCVGDYGEVRLIMQHGELRYINKVESQKAWKSADHQN